MRLLFARLAAWSQQVRTGAVSPALGGSLRTAYGLVAVSTVSVGGVFCLNSFSPTECKSSAVDKTTLVGKIALVTGGTGAIGAAVARDLAAQGCSVVVVDLDENKCKEFAATLPTHSIGIAIDVSSESAVMAGVARVVDEMGAVDILVNVAGILSNTKVFETSAEEWRRVHAINYDAVFYLSKACMPHMQQQQWGRVINLSSWAWKSGGLTAGTAYSASKGALVGLTFSLARQFAGLQPCAGHALARAMILPCRVLTFFASLR